MRPLLAVARRHERQAELCLDLLRPFPAEEMLGHPVSTLVNSTRS